MKGQPSAIYYLAITFTFSDGTQVEFFTNMKVIAPGQPIPTMNSLWYDTGGIAGLPAQNTFNSAYNIFAAGNAAHLESRYYFDGNPAAVASKAAPAQSTSSLASTFRSTNLSQPSIFENMPDSSYGAPIALPYLAPGQTSATGHFAYSSYDSVTNNLDIPQTGTVTVTQQATTMGTHTFSYIVIVDEPFAVRAGSRSDVVVGAYVLDNGFSGPVADGQGSRADNLGEGRFFAFYSNPGAPQPSQPDASHLRFTWAPPDPLSEGGGTAVSYILSVEDLTAEADLRRPVQQTFRTTATQQDIPSGVGGPVAVVAGHRYQGTVQAQFRFPDGSQISSDLITGPPIVAAAGSGGVPATQTATSPATPTQTPLPTETATPLPTATPQPTATPTPLRGSAVLLLDPDAGVYAWVHTLRADDPLAPDAWYATTWGNARPDRFVWQAGRPLHQVPALDSSSARVLLVLTDENTGAMAYVHPMRADARGYVLTDAGCGSLAGNGGATPTPLPYATSPVYGSQVDPAASAASHIAWVPAGMPVAAQAVRCDLATLTHRGGTVHLRFRVQRTLTFDVLFPTSTPRPPVAPTVGAGTPTATTTPVPPPVPTDTPAPVPPWPTSHMMSAPVTVTPQPFGCVGSCPATPPPAAWLTPQPLPTAVAGDVSMRTAENALATLPGATYQENPHGSSTAMGQNELLITIPSTDDHTITYTLLLKREVGRP